MTIHHTARGIFWKMGRSVCALKLAEYVLGATLAMMLKDMTTRINLPPARQGRKISNSTPPASPVSKAAAYAGTVMIAAEVISINSRGTWGVSQLHNG